MSEEVAVRNFETFANELWSLKNQKMFCDATLVVNGERIAVHAVVLASSSNYFKSVFGDSAIKEITLKDIDKEVVLSLIEFCYTGKIKITEKNAINIFNMANVLSILTVFESYSTTLEKNLNASNCLTTWKISQMGNLEQLKNKSIKYAIENFGKVSRHTRFLNLEYSDLIQLLGADLTKFPDMVIYNAVKNWVNHDRDSRKVHLSSLLEFVKLTCLPQEFLIAESLSFCDSEGECYRKLIAARQLQKKNGLKKCTSFHTLMAVGADDLELSKTIEIFDIINEEWVEIKGVNVNRKKFTASLLNDRLMLIGGYDGKSSFNTVEFYELKTRKLESAVSMKHSRYRLSAVQCEGCVFAIGGWNGTENLANVEKWHPESKVWQDVADLNTPRQSCGAVVLADEIYVIGGKGDSYLDSVEMYNSSTNKWTYRKSLNNKREGPGVAVVGEYIYAVGGQSDKVLKTAERYDRKSDTWTIIQSMEVGRSFMGAGNLMGQLMIAGGYKSLSSVIIYDDKEDKWSNTTSLNKPRDEFSLIEIPWTLAETVISNKI